MKSLRKLGIALSLFAMLAFIGHVEHEGHDHSKNLKNHDCICHTVGMVSCGVAEVSHNVSVSEVLNVARRTFECEVSPLFLNPPRAPPAS